MRSVFAISSAIALFAASAYASENADFNPVNFVDNAASVPASLTTEFVNFRWKGEEATAKESFDLNVENTARIQVTDYKNRGDIFEIFDNGKSLGLTTKVDAIKDEEVFAATPEEALNDDRFSKGTFDLAKGEHKITIKAVGPYEAGTAAIRVLDHANVAFHKKEKDHDDDDDEDDKKHGHKGDDNDEEDDDDNDDDDEDDKHYHKDNHHKGGEHKQQEGGWKKSGNGEQQEGGWKKGGDGEQQEGGWKKGGDGEQQEGGWKKGGDGEQQEGGWKKGGNRQQQEGGWKKGGDDEQQEGSWKKGGEHKQQEGGWKKGGDNEGGDKWEHNRPVEEEYDLHHTITLTKTEWVPKPTPGSDASVESIGIVI